jgi:hypothetical protein
MIPPARVGRPSFDDEDAPLLNAIPGLISWRGPRHRTSQAEAIRHVVSYVYGDNANDPHRKRAIERLRKKYRKQRADLERAWEVRDPVLKWAMERLRKKHRGSDRPDRGFEGFPWFLLCPPLRRHDEFRAELTRRARQIDALAERISLPQRTTMADIKSAERLLLVIRMLFGKNPF